MPPEVTFSSLPFPRLHAARVRVDTGEYSGCFGLERGLRGSAKEMRAPAAAIGYVRRGGNHGKLHIVQVQTRTPWPIYRPS